MFSHPTGDRAGEVSGDGEVGDLRAYPFGVVAQDDDDLPHLASPQRGNDVFDKSLAADGEQGLGAAHPARFTSREDHSDDHGTTLSGFASGCADGYFKAIFFLPLVLQQKIHNMACHLA